MAILINFSSTSSHLHPLQVENCGSNSRLVVDEDDNGKFRLERVKSNQMPLTSKKIVEDVQLLTLYHNILCSGSGVVRIHPQMKFYRRQILTYIDIA